eukprot:TRINITY_DN67708_c0_g1_i1.p1 TRINITY_DN67708_c0_g1~~TRINITY_DN67708_c0_g1_i1.p1  ORF type:complete len:738 (+),score=86.40 TRINITY_DN67708_c0_g1_i1:36-2216(+)
MISQGFGLHVIDPAVLSGKVWIPQDKLIETFGSRDNTSKKEPSLCMLYQAGRCNAAARCRQIHADRPYILSIRLQSAATGTCCTLHGDMASNDPAFVQLFQPFAEDGLSVWMQITGRQDVLPVPKNRIARTFGLDLVMGTNYQPSQQLLFHQSKVCGLHQKKRCRYGRDCKHIHLCRDFWNDVVQQLALPTTELQDGEDVQDDDDGLGQPAEAQDTTASEAPIGATAGTDSSAAQSDDYNLFLAGDGRPSRREQPTSRLSAIAAIGVLGATAAAFAAFSAAAGLPPFLPRPPPFKHSYSADSFFGKKAPPVLTVPLPSGSVVVDPPVSVGRPKPPPKLMHSASVGSDIMRRDMMRRLMSIGLGGDASQLNFLGFAGQQQPPPQQTANPQMMQQSLFGNIRQPPQAPPAARPSAPQNAAFPFANPTQTQRTPGAFPPYGPTVGRPPQNMMGMHQHPHQHQQHQQHQHQPHQNQSHFTPGMTSADIAALAAAAGVLFQPKPAASSATHMPDSGHNTSPPQVRTVGRPPFSQSSSRNSLLTSLSLASSDHSVGFENNTESAPITPTAEFPDVLSQPTPNTATGSFLAQDLARLSNPRSTDSQHKVQFPGAPTHHSEEFWNEPQKQGEAPIAALNREASEEEHEKQKGGDFGLVVKFEETDAMKIILFESSMCTLVDIREKVREKSPGIGPFHFVLKGKPVKTDHESLITAVTAMANGLVTVRPGSYDVD